MKEKDYIVRHQKEKGYDVNYIQDEQIINRNGSVKDKLDLLVKQKRRAAMN